MEGRCVPKGHSQQNYHDNFTLSNLFPKTPSSNYNSLLIMQMPWANYQVLDLTANILDGSQKTHKRYFMQRAKHSFIDSPAPSLGKKPALFFAFKKKW